MAYLTIVGGLFLSWICWMIVVEIAKRDSPTFRAAVEAKNKRRAGYGSL